MSTRIDKSWVVLESVENDEHDRCVDLFRRHDGSFGFEVFRRDVEDAGELLEGPHRIERRRGVEPQEFVGAQVALQFRGRA